MQVFLNLLFINMPLRFFLFVLNCITSHNTGALYNQRPLSSTPPVKVSVKALPRKARRPGSKAAAFQTEVSGAVASPLGLLSAPILGAQTPPLLAVELLANATRVRHNITFLVFVRCCRLRPLWLQNILCNVNKLKEINYF